MPGIIPSTFFMGPELRRNIRIMGEHVLEREAPRGPSSRRPGLGFLLRRSSPAAPSTRPTTSPIPRIRPAIRSADEGVEVLELLPHVPANRIGRAGDRLEAQGGATARVPVELGQDARRSMREALVEHLGRSAPRPGPSSRRRRGSWSSGLVRAWRSRPTSTISLLVDVQAAGRVEQDDVAAGCSRRLLHTLRRRPSGASEPLAVEDRGRRGALAEDP